MTLWALGSLGHFVLTAHWLGRKNPSISRDELWFQTMALGMGTLLVAFHALASTVGLSVGGVVLLLSGGHAGAWWVDRGLRSQAALRNQAADRGLRDQAALHGLLERAAFVVLTAVVLQWILDAMDNAGVSGSDAAHYHVPNAVNLALGGSPFDLPPTSHLYPMGSSMLAAWFLLPVETTLLTDLVMVLPFLLLVASAGWLFRQLTGVSGLAWCTWMMLALFAAPLFRSSSLMSADLLFAAATMAFAAAALTPLLRRELRSSDVWLLAMSLGLLLGSKVTGFIAAGLIGLPALVAAAVIRVRPATNLIVIAVAAMAVIGAGGIWLVRNWWVWGSPMAPNGVTLFGMAIFPGAPYEPTNYLSVLGDLSEKPGYLLWDRVRHFSAQWLSPWYLPALSALALIPLDFVIGRARGATASRTRVWALLVALGTGAILAWFLIGAPWTSLEWTDGLSLRYALPWLVILPVVAWTGIFPESLRWYRHAATTLIAGAVIAGGSLAIFASADRAFSLPPWPSLLVIVVATAIVGAKYALSLVSTRWKWLLVSGAIVRGLFLLHGWTADADLRAQEAKAAVIAAGPRSLGEQIYDAALAREKQEGQACDASGRRFFITNRFDEAGALQGPRLTNQVFYAGRDVKVTGRVRPSMGFCDYLISERAIMETDKGAMLHAGLNPSGRLVEVATIADVVLLVHR